MAENVAGQWSLVNCYMSDTCTGHV